MIKSDTRVAPTFTLRHSLFPIVGTCPTLRRRFDRFLLSRYTLMMCASPRSPWLLDLPKNQKGYRDRRDITATHLLHHNHFVVIECRKSGCATRPNFHGCAITARPARRSNERRSPDARRIAGNPGIRPRFRIVPYRELRARMRACVCACALCVLCPLYCPTKHGIPLSPSRSGSSECTFDDTKLCLRCLSSIVLLSGVTRRSGGQVSPSRDFDHYITREFSLTPRGGTKPRAHRTGAKEPNCRANIWTR